MRSRRALSNSLTERLATLVERFFKPNRPLALTQQARAAINKCVTYIKRTPTLIA